MLKEEYKRLPEPSGGYDWGGNVLKLLSLWILTSVQELNIIR